MPHPTDGDTLLRDAASGYVVVDAMTLQPLAGPYPTIAEAALTARRLIGVGEGHVWRDNVDGRGRRLGEPFLLELQPSTVA